jgi:hypothetical protein
MNTLATFYCFKENSVAKTSIYLGAQIREYKLPDNPGKLMWSMSAEKYLKEALHNLDAILLMEDKLLPNRL